MMKIRVAASKPYDVLMSPGLLAAAGTHIKYALGLKGDPTTGKIENRRICIVTDSTVEPLYAMENQGLWASLATTGFAVCKYVFPGGERHKTMAAVEGLLDFLTSHNFSRSDLLLALGGGITGDVTGFAAAVYLRGIDYIQVPTSLLAVVDSSVGGKTGVNLKAGKNLAGAFWQPSLVLFDPDVLATLSDELKLDGIAEAIKAGLIAEPRIIDAVENELAAGAQGVGYGKPGAGASPQSVGAEAQGIAGGNANSSGQQRIPADTNFLTALAASAVEVKRRIVEEDERDEGRRQLLNFGHTIAHAIERCSDYSISHGHAVAMGMAIVATAADRLGLTEEPCGPKIIGLLKRFGFPLDCPYSPAQLAEAALQDKKICEDRITLVVPVAIGMCILKTIPVSQLEQFISCGMNV
ncbi:MAG: 3-dehydroquinate synthase [Planctomycetia bacterium]|nr:3-dehydroquinate synthase [Planctomycetia bacterium]